MPPLIKVGDQPNLYPTKDFPYAKFRFEYLNPVQSRVIDFYEKDANALIASSTNSGKSLIAQIYIAHEISKRKGKAIFLAPLRALAREKYEDWKNDAFKDYKICILTGDYRLTRDRLKELEEADIIIMTLEMLLSRCRNISSEQSDFLKQVGTLVTDESHEMGSSRGNHLEVGLMKFSKINPNARHLMLSATLPNVDELAEWVSYALNKKETYVVKSTFRPVPLNIHYELYCDDIGRYDILEEEKANKVLEIVEWYKDDKFLVFVHTKKTGELVKNKLRMAKIDAEFHNADLDQSRRIQLENDFRNNPKLRVVIATSTLSSGLNMPARRVIVVGPYRGLEEIEAQECIQAAGRAGRLGLDSMGDAYILIPESKQQYFKSKFSKLNNIESQLLSSVGTHHKTLAFHLVSEIHHGEIETNEDVHNWYKRSLAYFQNKTLDDSVVDSTMELLRKCGAVAQEGDKWFVRPIGKIASMFYFSPFDVSDLYFNFKELFEKRLENDDYHISMALGNIDSQRMNIVSRAEKEEMSRYNTQVKSKVKKFFNDASCKAGYCYFNLINGHNSQFMASLQRNLQFDYNRVSQVLLSLDSMAAKWDRDLWFQNLESRITHGVPSHLIELTRINNIGKVRANRLYDAGIKNAQDLANVDKAKLKTLLKMKIELIEEIIKEAKIIELTT